MASVVAITSGKGGVGKTNIATNLGLALAARNARVCVFDADTGLANINILLGIHPQFTLEHVLAGDMRLTDIILEVTGGLYVVPAASGIERCTDLSREKRKYLVDALVQLEKEFDYILVDTAAGIESGVLDFVASAQYRVVVITPEPTSLTDAFALLKMLSIRGGKRNLFALVNRVNDYKSSQKVFKRFQAAVEKYLKVDINYLGYLADDPALQEAVTQQTPVVIRAPNSSVSCCFFALADIIKRQFLNEKQLPYFSRYWQKISAARQKKIRQHEKAVATALSSATRQRPDILGWLERREYPEAEMRELIIAMESVYEKVHRKPIKTVDSVIAGLMADIHGNEEKARLLHKTLEHSFERQFHKPIDDPVEALVRQVQDQKFSRSDFSALLTRFAEIYQARFGVRYFGDGERLLEKIARLLQNQ